MNAVTLADTITHNLCRDHRLDVLAEHFGAWCFVRDRGRTGQTGQGSIAPRAGRAG
jgi:hypothetical protein